MTPRGSEQGPVGAENCCSSKRGLGDHLGCLWLPGVMDLGPLGSGIPSAGKSLGLRVLG